MSRSYRRPYIGNPDGSKEWKSEANRKIRREREEEIVKGSYYKKKSDVWDSPMEHKGGYWDVPKLRRK